MCERLLQIDEPKSLKIFFSPKTWGKMKLLFAWGDAALRRLFQRQPFTRLCHKRDITGQCAPSTQKAFHLRQGQGTGYASSCSASRTVTFSSLPLTHSSQITGLLKQIWKTNCYQPEVTFQEIFNARKLVVGRASFFSSFCTENREEQL